MDRNSDGTYTVTCRYIICPGRKYMKGEVIPKDVGEPIFSHFATSTVTKRGCIDWVRKQFTGNVVDRGEIEINPPPGISREDFLALLERD